MKRYTSYIFAVLSLALTAACTARIELPKPAEEICDEGIVMTLYCQDPEEATKAAVDKPGITEWNENRIRTVDLYFYPQGGTGSNSVLHYRYTGEKEATVTIPVNVTDADVDAICPRPNQTFQVYAIVNFPDLTTLDNLTNTSIDNLKTLAITTDFVTRHKQESFIMDGQSLVNLDSRTRRLVAQGTISLQRLAAKISVQISVPDNIEVTATRKSGDEVVTYTEHWTPATDEMKVYIENGVKNTTLAGEPAASPVYFNYRDNMLEFSESSDTENASYPWVTDPMYTYPQRWEYASQTSPTIEPDIKLLLPWTRVEESVEDSDGNTYNVPSVKKQFYYKIMVPDDDRGDDFLKHFVRNNWYKFKVNVGILGSETDEASVTVSGHYYVVGWENHEVVIKHAEIGLARFLSVDQDAVVLNNENDCSISFTTSHPVMLKDISVTKPYYGSSSSTYNDGVGPLPVSGGTVTYDEAARKARNSGEDWVTVSGSRILFSHELDNVLTSDGFDTSPYTVSFTVIHKDLQSDANTAYQERVTIVQYPSMYIKSELSNGRVFLKGNENDSARQNLKDDSNNEIGSLLKRSDINDNGSNTNPRQYTIHLSVLPSGFPYMIGDPRTDGSKAVVTTLTGLNSGANYRPTAENTQNIIAPAVKIASSYGRTQALWYENARTRCAAYQENGYPAGRWRLPTAAEIEFFVTLSEAELIPSLFNPGASSKSLTASNEQNYYYYSYYWSGGGFGYYGSGFTKLTDFKALDGSGTPSYTFNNQSYYSSTQVNGRNHHSGYTRCVYDVWYWGDDPDANHMTTWGGYQTTR